MVGLMATSSKRTYAICGASQVFCSQSPGPHGRPLLTHASAGDTQKGRSGSVSLGSLGPGVPKVLFEPSKHLWSVWGFSPPTILLGFSLFFLLLPSCWASPLALDVGYLFLGGIQHSPVGGGLAVSCNFEVLTEDEGRSFYSTILHLTNVRLYAKL